MSPDLARGGATNPVDGPLDPPAIAGMLAATAATLDAEMRALGEAACWHPSPGEWCANEVLGHIIEAERRGFNGRVRRFLTEDEPNVIGWDQLAVAAERRDCERDPGSLLEEFLPLREESIALVAALKPVDLARFGLHDRVGRLTVGDLIGEWVHHDRNHVRQLLANGQARVWPQMGNAQRFGAPD
jgi:hypothetical protein